MRVIPCPLCAAPAFTPTVSRTRRGREYQVVRCAECGFYYTNPEPTPAELGDFYEGEYQERHADVWHGLEDSANRAVIRLLRKLGVRSLVDLGSGQGRFVSMARAEGIDASGVEPMAGNVAEAEERYGFRMRQQTVADYLAAGPREVECFTLLNVLEHLPDPLGVSRAMHGALRTGGRVVVIVPDVSFTLFLGRLRRLAGMRDPYMVESQRFSQQGFDPPVHLSSFDAAHLRTVFERAGLHVERIRPAPVIRTRSALMNVAKHTVRAVGVALGAVTLGSRQWGYSLLGVASRPD